MTQEDETRIPGEREETITGRRIDNNPLLKRGAVAIAIVAFVGFALWSTTGKKAKDENVQPERVVIRQTNPFEAAKEKAEPAQVVPEVKLPTPVVEPVAEESDKLLESARRAPVMAFSSGQENAKDRRETDNPDTSNNGNFVPLDNNMMAQNQQSSDQQRFDGLLRPTRLEGSRAGTLGNRDFIVAMGASIPCVLETALASDQPGFASCVINRDVLSDNGRVVLMEKGTQVVGEYRGGLQRGQKRLFVLWNRVKTPKGVIVTLASPATDALGRAGVAGYVDTHWWERFGSALLLSIVGDATSYASSRLQDSDVDAQNTTSAGQQAAAIAVEQSINIPPTLNKHQGELVSIFVARDLDFSGIYRLRVTEPRNRIFDRAVLGDFSPQSTLVTK
ncbi:type IV secretion protein VirB10 [Agrobacterium sp. TS43]|uniref:type IV secretion system protein VirB10 n=1 Tax=Agrobacterium TaxID=357 RepID=UPI00036E1E62|nr:MULTISPECIES: type IV secretion system protein VirB10 [Agrobacterium]EPR21184.1 type IV secretion protein VirB10 [Agrobacterium radiobacter DSM 30147]KDR89306.1 type IV secretion protein VirB10 [Agrobacterium tumefaciens GW4]KVK50002.1 type IV secretion protein VirB10 [Agrobacterium sp. JL28]KVK50292.1 type IV secretion protein VirB10 [Agrobacterium sp. LY4]KVK59337.1 type IV secretion protein VirB10 [Agrobacterium sp. TS43]